MQVAAVQSIEQWILDLHWRDNFWHGQLQGEPDAFLAALSSMDARLISLNLARASLEEFFIDQLRQRGMTSSQ